MEREPRILFLDTRPIRRGAQIFVHELKHRFSLEGLTVRRIFLYTETNYEQLPLDEHDLVMPFRDNHFFEKFPTIQTKLVKDLAQEIKLFAPDVILCNGSRTLKYAAVIKKCYPSIKAKWIYRVIDSAKYWNKRVFTKYCYKHFVIPSMDGAVGVSQKSLDEMIHHYGFKKPSVCIPRAIDVDYFANFLFKDGAREKIGIPNDAFVLLFLGNFTIQKRPDRFIDIIHALQKDLPLVYGLMVGDGPLKVKIQEKANQLGIQDKITYTGYQSDVRPWIAMSDLLLLTSDTEGMPGVVLEAAAMKIPSISGNVGGVAEFIEDGLNGFIVDWNSTMNYLKLIVGLTKEKQVLKNIGDIAGQNVKKRFSIQIICTEYYNFFVRCLLSKSND